MNNEGAALNADAKGIQEAIDALDRDAIDVVNALSPYSGVVQFTGFENLYWEATTGPAYRNISSGAYISEVKKLDAVNYFATDLEDAAKKNWVHQLILKIKILLMAVLLLPMRSWKMQIKWVKRQMMKRQLRSKL